ncbi:MAG TPA: NAD(P)/FAD-dependent oxidoreductase [Candidatus Angelobacter sp.]
MDIAIFGAGAAGLMTAITLHRTGHQVRVFEKCRQSHTAGMGFILVPDCIAGLRGFGVEVPGIPLEHFLFRDSDGRVLQQQTMPHGSQAIRRRDLIAALVHSLPTPETLTLDVELENLQLDERRWVRAARLNSGGRSTLIHSDLYIAADGIGSRGRQVLFPHWPTPQAQVMEVVGLVECKATVRWAADNFNKFHAAQGGLALGILPVDPEHVVWFLQFDARHFPPPQENPESRRDFVNRLAGDWADPIPHLLANTDFSRMHLWQPVDADLVPHFSQGNLVLVGDAAHPLLPFTSQGVAAAIADAVTLAAALKTSGDLVTALTGYSLERRQQCSPYVARGRELMRNFLNPRGALAALPIA